MQNPNLRTPVSEGRAFILVLVFIAIATLAVFGYRTLGPDLVAFHATTIASARSTNVHAPFGWLGFIATPLYVALGFTHEHGIGNWGWTIVTFTAVFNVLLIWPRLLAVRSSVKMMRLQPQVEAVRKRYAHLRFDDPKRGEMQAEIMGIYKADGATIYGGCVPMLLQMPLFIAYVRVLQGAGELHHAPWLWIADLASADPLHVLPMLIVATMVLTQLLAPAGNMDAAQRRLLLFGLPLFMGFTLWHCASGLALYWLTGNLFSLAFQFVVNRSSLGREMRRTGSVHRGGA